MTYARHVVSLENSRKLQEVLLADVELQEVLLAEVELQEVNSVDQAEVATVQVEEAAVTCTS